MVIRLNNPTGSAPLLPKTEQTVEYYAGDDGTYEAGNQSTPRFIDNGDGTISDKVTSLMWLKNSARIIPGSVGVTSNNQTIQDAGTGNINTNYVKGDFVFDDAGTSYWAVAEDFSISCPSWATATDYAVNDYVYDGISEYFRCLVANHSGNTTLADDILAEPTWWLDIGATTGGVFYDWNTTIRTTQMREVTGWSTGFNVCAQIAWEPAVSNSDFLEYAGHTDWRTPNIIELMTLVDFSANTPAIDTTFFPLIDSSEYWSGTTSSLDNLNAWVVDFGEGAVSNSLKTNLFISTAVRGGKVV